MIPITSKTQFKKICDSLNNQGFNINIYHSINDKISYMINQCNIYQVNINISNIVYDCKLDDIDNFYDIEQTIKKYFERYTIQYKINELLSRIHLFEEMNARLCKNY